MGADSCVSGLEVAGAEAWLPPPDSWVGDVDSRDDSVCWLGVASPDRDTSWEGLDSCAGCDPCDGLDSCVGADSVVACGACEGGRSGAGPSVVVVEEWPVVPVCEAVLALAELRPGNALAANSANTPVSATLPAISQRLA